jgi:hypothetical protein
MYIYTKCFLLLEVYLDLGQDKLPEWLKLRAFRKSLKQRIMPSQEGSCERYARALLPYLG